MGQAEDLTQETFRRFLGRASKSGARHPRSLLFHIARNPLIDRIAARWRFPAGSMSPSQHSSIKET